MKYLLVCVLFGSFVAAGLSQTQKAKPTAQKPKPTPTRSKAASNKSNATTSKPKITASKATTVPKPKASASNQKSSPKPKAKTAPASAKPAAGRATIARTQPTPPPVKRPSEKSEWDAALTITGRDARIAVLRKFIEAFPRSKLKAEGQALISGFRADMGNEKLASGEVEAAAVEFKASVTDAPSPIPDVLFNEKLSRFAANLYFRNLREPAIEIVRSLEEKAGTSAAQLLNIANFYLSVENGSDAKRIAEKAIALDAKSAAAYQTLGLANRMDFLLEESAAAYAKALELEPDSILARRGLAEMKRSLGKSDDAVVLYREILAKDETNVPAHTGLILALFDVGKRVDAETELERSLAATPGNVILLGGAAYWYAAQGEGEKAVDYAQKAVAVDPRFIWSHIALARGFLAQNKPAEAEKTLLAARRYGNFPTLSYELATVRLAAGYYRDATDELAKNFSVKDGIVTTKLGARIARGSKQLVDLVGLERRASIFAPVAADTAENATKLVALLEFKQALDAREPSGDALARTADEFIRGDDKMKVHRQVFAASELVDKKAALPKAVEIVKAAAANISAGLDVSVAPLAVMASELYEARAIADSGRRYVEVPEVPQATLSAILRGRLEDIAGRALYHMDARDDAVNSLRRAVGILPPQSAWWRSSMWRLGAALALSGKDPEALDAYVTTYKNSVPDPIRYGIIETLYRKVHGKTDDLERTIGPNPAPVVAPQAVAKVEVSTPDLTSPVPTPVPTLVPTPTPAAQEPSPSPTATPAAEPSPTLTPSPVMIATPGPTTEPTREATPSPTPSATPLPAAAPTLTTILGETIAVSTPTGKKRDLFPNPAPKLTELFPPVIISVRPPETSATTKESDAKPEPKPTPEKKPDTPSNDKPAIPETASASSSASPCVLTVDKESINLASDGREMAIIVRLEDDAEFEAMKAVSSNPEDVRVRPEPITGVKTSALFVLRSVSGKAGVFQITFELPCGKRSITVRVR